MVILVFIANILIYYLPSFVSQPDIPPGAPPLPPRYQPDTFSFSEILLFSIISTISNPLVLILGMGGGLWLILSSLGKRETAIPDRYRIYLMFILTVIAILSIQFLSMKVIKTPPLYPPLPTQSQYPIWEYNSSIIPSIIVVSAVSIFIAITTYMRRYYPYAAIFASALLGIVYLTALPYITPEYSVGGWIGVAIDSISIPVLVIASALWRGEKMDVAYPIAYSSVLGIVAGVALPPSYAGWEMIGISALIFLLTFLFGIFTIISFLTKSKYESASKYFIPSLKVTLSLIVFLIMMFVTYGYIFQPYYNPHGLSD